MASAAVHFKAEILLLLIHCLMLLQMFVFFCLFLVLMCRTYHSFSFCNRLAESEKGADWLLYFKCIPAF